MINEMISIIAVLDINVAPGRNRGIAQYTLEQFKNSSFTV